MTKVDNRELTITELELVSGGGDDDGASGVCKAGTQVGGSTNANGALTTLVKVASVIGWFVPGGLQPR
jgi:hypothetical protein